MPDPQKPSQSAIFFLKQLHSKNLDPLKLTRHQRKICVRHLLREHKYSQQEIGQIVGCSRENVSQIKSRILEQDSWMLSAVDERKEAVEIMQKAEACFTHLMKQGKYKDAWNVAREKIEVLQSLGYVKRTPVEIGGQITLLEILKHGKAPAPRIGEQLEISGVRQGLGSLQN